MSVVLGEKTTGENTTVHEVAMPSNEKGIGSVILKADAADLIDGVVVQPFPLWPDDRGYFAEVIRIGKGPAGNFPTESTQVSAALSYPGTIKAFHIHKHQTDFWAPVAGMFQVALVDLRAGSKTHGRRNTFYLGKLRSWQLIIPPGVAHGYKVIGTEPALLVYVTNRFYNPDDEGRIPYNHTGIHYDWEMQHK